jgi:hypothetical protein
MRQRLLLLVSVAGLILYGGGAADAATMAITPSAGHYCVAKAMPVGSSRTAHATCFTTFARAIATATDGRVRLAAWAKPGSVTPNELNAGAEAPDTEFVLSIDYQNSNFGGGTLTWTQTSRCGSFRASSMPSGWNDTISSVIASSGCANTLFKNDNFGSTSFGIAKNGTAASLGSFNDEASSETWCPGLPCAG